MATHGKAREATVSALTNHKAFRRSGYGMSAVEGAVSDVGYLASFDPEAARRYYAWRAQDAIAYTVLSYRTVIGWVTVTGDAVIPKVTYSRTTSSHQGLLYLI